MHSNQKGYVYWQIQGNSSLALAFEYAEELLPCLFFRSTFSVSYPFKSFFTKQTTTRLF